MMEWTCLNFCFLLFITSATLGVVRLQPSMSRTDVGSCTVPTLGELGSLNVPSSTGLIAATLTGSDASGQPVQIVDAQNVCQASGTTRGTVSSVSFVVQYMVCPGGECGTPLAEQFQFDCAVDLSNVASFLEGARGTSGTDLGNATLETELMDRCGRCSELNSDPDTHCVACNPGCVGLGKCLGTELDQCCNYYQNNTCVIACSSPLVPDDNFDCGCGDLDVPNADVTFTNGFLIGSVATQTCQDGTVPSDRTGTRTCTMTGWDGQDISCTRFECPASDLIIDQFGTVTTDPATEPHYVGTVATFQCNEGYVLSGSNTRRCELTSTTGGGWTGDNPVCTVPCMEDDLKIDNGAAGIDPSPIVVGSIANFICDEGFVLDGDKTRECGAGGWSGTNPQCKTAEANSGSSSACGTGCIVGIVLAVLGVIILAAILAGVAYAVYSYMNHPDTKLAKYDPDSINGVAKDNPLYVDPEAVVGDGAEAA